MRYVEGNLLHLLANGEQFFPALVGAIDAARSEVFLETYLFADDQTGSLVCDALARAAARGVRTRLLLDGFGARDFAPRFARMLRDAGAERLVYRPVRSVLLLRRSRLRRMHRKLASVDGAVAFVGGINVIDDFDARGGTPPRFDYAVRIEGPLAAEVRAEAARLWRQVSRAQFRAAPALGEAPGPPGLAGAQRAALVVRDNLRHRRDIEEAYLHHISESREEIVIACAYFFPGRRMRRALVEAAQRGVRVELLLQGRIEYPLLHYASRALYGSLLDAGVAIHEYHLSYLHAKVAVFDRAAACVGSSNIDPFSLMLALEANVFVDDARFAQELHGGLTQAMHSGARALPPRHWKRLPLWQRLRIWAGYGLARLLLSFFGLERYH
jgi:cardiolipin synthase